MPLLRLPELRAYWAATLLIHRTAVSWIFVPRARRKAMLIEDRGGQTLEQDCRSAFGVVAANIQPNALMNNHPVLILE
jgi:hypothetical protein